MEEWNTERSSSELIEQVRKIILVPAGVQWSIEEGEFVEGQSQGEALLGREETVDN
jgi:hypothetical protein